MNAPEFTKTHLNLAAPRIGAEALSCSDDFFASMHRMLGEAEPVFIIDKYDDHGKWMDGWESRRKRVAGYDWCVVKLGVRGKVEGVEIDTSFFTGNFPPEASLEAANVESEVDDNTVWTQILAKTPLEGDKKHWFKLGSNETYSHVRLNIFPDGGVARLRVFGTPDVNWGRGKLVNLAALECGAKALAWSDSHYGDANKMFSPSKSQNMGDGWETRRRREEGNDWLVFKLAHAGEVEAVLADTAFFKGNYPDGFSLRGVMIEGELSLNDIEATSANWPEMLGRSKLSADNIHEFDRLNSVGIINHVRVDIYPDGGISRLKLFGKIKG
jgi:allantoicase